MFPTSTAIKTDATPQDSAASSLWPATDGSVPPTGLQWPPNAAMMASLPAMMMMQAQMQAQMAAAAAAASNSNQPHSSQPSAPPFGMPPVMLNGMLPFGAPTALPPGAMNPFMMQMANMQAAMMAHRPPAPAMTTTSALQPSSTPFPHNRPRPSAPASTSPTARTEAYDGYGDDGSGPDGLPSEQRRLRNRQKSVTYRENKKVELKHLKIEATELFTKCSKTYAIAKAYLDIGSDARKGAVRLHLATVTPSEQEYLSNAFRSPYVKPPPRPDTSRGRSALDNLAGSGKSRAEIMRERNRLNSFHYRQEKKKEFQAWQDAYEHLLMLSRKLSALDDLLVSSLSGNDSAKEAPSPSATVTIKAAPLKSHTTTPSASLMAAAALGGAPQSASQQPGKVASVKPPSAALVQSQLAVPVPVTVPQCTSQQPEFAEKVTTTVPEPDPDSSIQSHKNEGNGSTNNHENGSEGDISKAGTSTTLLGSPHSEELTHETANSMLIEGSQQQPAARPTLSDSDKLAYVGNSEPCGNDGELLAKRAKTEQQ
eukprot:m.60870 g.60870  ORF g.60870 m.60870 type:complete len:539 (+) comp13863_c0_seq7:338-1954(+)